MKPKPEDLAELDLLLTVEPGEEPEEVREFALPLDGGSFEWLARRAGTASASNDFIASTSKEARDGDIIDQASWKLGHFRRNPVILDNHDPGAVVGRATDVKVVNGELRASIEWDDSPENPRGQLVAHQHRNGFRKAVSVRWLPGKRTMRNQLPKDHPAYSKGKKVRMPWGEEVTRVGEFHENNTLLEISTVSIPSDPRALQTRGFAADVAARLAGDEPEEAPEFVRVSDLPALFLKFLRSTAARRVILGAALTEPTTPTTPNESAPVGDGLDHLYGDSQ